MYRYERQLKCVEKAERMAREAGFTPEAVPPKVLFPLLEGASMEEDESLHDMWAALLANAASPTYNADIVRPSFMAMLRVLTGDEAALLKWMYDQVPHLARQYPERNLMPPLPRDSMQNAHGEQVLDRHPELYEHTFEETIGDQIVLALRESLSHNDSTDHRKPGSSAADLGYTSRLQIDITWLLHP
jgi:Abortive infection alpha